MSYTHVGGTLIDDLVRRLYEAGLSVPSDQFANWALHQCQDELHCDGISWELINAHGEQLLQRLAGRWDQHHALNAIFPQVQPKLLIVTVPTGIAGQRHYFGYARYDKAFEESERLLLRRISPFLVHAEQVCQQHAALRTPRSADRSGVEGQATVNGNGRITSCDAAFRDYVLIAEPRWSGDSLPFRLSDATTMVYKDLFFRLEPQGDLVRVTVRRDRRAPQLSPREMQIAQLVASGKTFKEIGSELGVATSTVSSHLYSLYAKLGIQRRAQLVQWLKRHAA